MRTAMKIVLVLSLVLVLAGITGSMFSVVRTTHKDGMDELRYSRGGMMNDSFYTRGSMMNNSFYARSENAYDYQEFCYNEQSEDEYENCPRELAPKR